MEGSLRLVETSARSVVIVEPLEVSGVKSPIKSPLQSFVATAIAAIDVPLQSLEVLGP